MTSYKTTSAYFGNCSSELYCGNVDIMPFQRFVFKFNDFENSKIAKFIFRESFISVGWEFMICIMVGSPILQELTTWTRETLNQRNMKLSTDLRKAISDGVTLPYLIDITCK